MRLLISKSIPIEVLLISGFSSFCFSSSFSFFGFIGAQITFFISNFHLLRFIPHHF